MSEKEIVLIDLSSLAYPIWHVSQSEPDPNHTSTQTVARVRAIASGKPAVAICCDSGRSFRRDIDSSYKANRPAQDGTLAHQITLACEQLAADGFPVWAEKGFEADDLVASAVARALLLPDATVLVVTSDKDLLQLVGPRVQAMSARDGSVLDADGVLAKFSVRPDQIRDFLTLVGDASDNIKGAYKIGAKTAATLLAKYQTIEGIYEALQQRGTEFTPALDTSLREFLPRLVTTRELVTLRTDVPLPFDEIFAVRVPKDAQEFEPFEPEDEGSDEIPQPTAERSGPEAPDRADAAKGEVTDLPGNGAAAPAASSASRLNLPTSIAVREPELLAPIDYERQLDPRSMKDARILAKDMHDSRLFSAYGTPQGVLSTVMLGRELGLPAMASLRGIHVIEGKHALSAQTMVALVLKSGLAEYFEPVEFDHLHAVFETKRKGARKEVRLQHTIEMAQTAGLVKPNSNWVKVPTDMLVARAQARLCRLVYPDIVGGLYTPDELSEIRTAVA
jgi:5'-3' exonuclease